MANTLKEEILAGRNFGELTHPHNPTQFGLIYFGDSGKKLYLANVTDNQCSMKCFDKEKRPN